MSVIRNRGRNRATAMILLNEQNLRLLLFKEKELITSFMNNLMLYKSLISD